MIARRRVLLGGGVVAALSLTVAGVLVLDQPGDAPAPAKSPDSLDDLMSRLTDAMSANGPYRTPKADERAAGVRGFTDLLDTDRPGDLVDLGFTVRDQTDAATGRRCTVARNELGTERAWGLYLIDRSAPPALVVEVPHPAFDLHTEIVGLELFRRVPGAVLLMAGAHRKADDNRADVAHQPDSLFNVLAGALAERGLPQVQLHGFHDDTQPGADIVLSPGAAAVGARITRAGDGLAALGLAVNRAWVTPSPDLEGRTNVQGKAAARDDTTFLHVEMSRTMRDDPRRRVEIAGALAGARLTDA